MFLKEEYAKKYNLILINTIFYQLCLKEPLLSVIYDTKQGQNILSCIQKLTM